MSIQVVTVSSKGQIAIPSEMRRGMSIDAGTKLAAYTDGDFIVLKPLKVPSLEEFRATLDRAASWAQDSGLSEDDVESIVKDARRRRREGRG
ncbi:MAG: AbrB/MazE/SpoVT family DNA-binding domain-containing protein [Spirochaetales bacterium]|nr:AbrB/MazE/SpoVT family DNA-binding domain-containing protein [Spirochaetales bacterium]MBQ3830063.1 AbrB/MazE/SpoVT family DNA-binding domain-containing protein [Spirochaetales bacterium]